MSSIRWFKVIALAEAVSYLVLLAAAVLKRTNDMHELVTVLGPIHGVIFLAYVAFALYVREQLRWNFWTTVMVVVAAVIPIGGLIVERRLPDEAPPAAETGAGGGGGGGGGEPVGSSTA